MLDDSYPGGKGGSGVYQKIINQIPPHRVYIEPFLGYGGIMRRKRPASQSYGIDADATTLAAWQGDEIPNLELVQDNALAWLFGKRHLLKSDTFVYIDPPYLMKTRRDQRPLYRHEFGAEDDHRHLVDVARGLNCMVAISGYWSELYADMLSDWRVISFQAQTRGGTTATEYLWMNYPEPTALHDYQYLGDDYQDRWRLTKKRRRWKKKFGSLPILERRALLQTIDELREEWR
jgi:hypothetical protein